MKSVQFIFGIHNHQPVGNFDYVFEEALNKSYAPFIEALERHPSISMVLHFSGCLIEWLEDHHPDFLDRINNLIHRHNIEMLSAGFYEPILAVIPDHDKLGQIKKMNTYIRDRFKYEVSGLWLTERVWEPHLAKPIKEAGIDYITVDDFHFLASGKKHSELTGYFNAEEQGQIIGVFPINQKLRYAMPFEKPEETIEILRNYVTEDGNNVIVMADDGEKFGVWPGTYSRCYGKDNWMEKFFRLLDKNQDWLKTTTFKDYYTNYLPKGRVSLATTSYFEMNEWTLPAKQGETFSKLVNRFNGKAEIEEIRPFLRGGTWRNFLSIYDEANWMHRRITDLSYRFANVMSSNNKNLNNTQDELWRSQCNCAYWHGIFGGLYLPHLRHAIYQHLIAAEKELDQVSGSKMTPRDIDSDGALEYQLQSDEIKILVSERGGIIQEFDYLPKNFNLLDTMRRYQESYHSRVGATVSKEKESGSIHEIITAKELGLEKYLQYDPWPRKMLLDHFISRAISAKRMQRGIPNQGDFIDAIYTSNSRKGKLKFNRDGKAFGQKIRMQKQLSLDGPKLIVNISIINLDVKLLSGLYCCEMNFAMLGGHTTDRYYEINGKMARPKFLDSIKSEFRIQSLGIVNEWDEFRVTIQFKSETNLWRFPVMTVSMSEAGFERVYQSSVVLPYWKLDLKPEESFATQFSVKVEELI